MSPLTSAWRWTKSARLWISSNQRNTDGPVYMNDVAIFHTTQINRQGDPVSPVLWWHRCHRLR